MSDTPNEKEQIDRSGLTINTDPDADARRLAEGARQKEAAKGVTRVTTRGSDKPNEQRGVKRVSRP